MDDTLIKIALYAELVIVSILLRFVPYGGRIGPYSRGMLERQLVGTRWLLDNNIGNMPSEARKLYLNQGRMMLIILATIVAIRLSNLVTVLLTND